VSIAIRIIGAGAAAAWVLLFALMVFLILPFSSSSTSVTFAFLAVPAVMTAAALWVAFRSAFRDTKLALAIESLLAGAGAFCLVIVAAASGG
jgi:hypothetical protein